MTSPQPITIHSIRKTLLDTAIDLKNGTISKQTADSIAEISRLFLLSFNQEFLKNDLAINRPLGQTATKNQEPGHAPHLTMVQSAKNELANPPKPAVNQEAVDILLANHVPKALIDEYLNLRAQRKVEFTTYTANQLLTESKKAGWTPEEAVSECCTRSWICFKAELVESRTSGSKPNPQKSQNNPLVMAKHIPSLAPIASQNHEAVAIQFLIEQGIMEAFVRDFLKIRAKKTSTPLTMDEVNELMNLASEKNLTVEEIIAIKAGWVPEDCFSKKNTLPQKPVEPNPEKPQTKKVETQPKPVTTPEDKTPMPENIPARPLVKTSNDETAPLATFQGGTLEKIATKKTTPPVTKKPLAAKPVKTPPTTNARIETKPDQKKSIQESDQQSNQPDFDQNDNKTIRKTSTGGIESIETKNGMVIRTHRSD